MSPETPASSRARRIQKSWPCRHSLQRPGATPATAPPLGLNATVRNVPVRQGQASALPLGALPRYFKYLVFPVWHFIQIGQKGSPRCQRCRKVIDKSSCTEIQVPRFPFSRSGRSRSNDCASCSFKPSFSAESAASSVSAPAQRYLLPRLGTAQKYRDSDRPLLGSGPRVRQRARLSRRVLRLSTLHQVTVQQLGQLAPVLAFPQTEQYSAKTSESSGRLCHSSRNARTAFPGDSNSARATCELPTQPPPAARRRIRNPSEVPQKRAPVRTTASQVKELQNLLSVRFADSPLQNTGTASSNLPRSRHNNTACSRSGLLFRREGGRDQTLQRGQGSELLSCRVRSTRVCNTETVLGRFSESIPTGAGAGSRRLE